MQVRRADCKGDRSSCSRGGPRWFPCGEARTGAGGTSPSSLCRGFALTRRLPEPAPRPRPLTVADVGCSLTDSFNQSIWGRERDAPGGPTGFLGSTLSRWPESGRSLLPDPTAVSGGWPGLGPVSAPRPCADLSPTRSCGWSQWRGDCPPPAPRGTQGSQGTGDSFLSRPQLLSGTDHCTPGGFKQQE